jgi:hypothetical protein
MRHEDSVTLEEIHPPFQHDLLWQRDQQHVGLILSIKYWQCFAAGCCLEVCSVADSSELAVFPL